MLPLHQVHKYDAICLALTSPCAMNTARCSFCLLLRVDSVRAKVGIEPTLDHRVITAPPVYVVDHRAYHTLLG